MSATAAAALGAMGGSSTMVSAATAAKSKSDLKRLYLWGDSRTHGAGDVAPYQFQNYLQKYLPGVAITNEGMGGQTAAQIVARQGGWPTELSFEGNTIPGSGQVHVTTSTVDIFYGVTTATYFQGTIDGVTGTYSSKGDFARLTPGNATYVTPGRDFRLHDASTGRSAVMFLCVGENGVKSEDPELIVGYTGNAVAYLSPQVKYYMVGGVMPDLTAINGSAVRTRYDTLNALLREKHGHCYLDLVSPPTAEEMAKISYIASSLDLGDIDVGVFPRGMFGAATDVHLNRHGQQLWALRVYRHYESNGWI